jgi:hypothetical protein
MHTVIETKFYEGSAKVAGISEEERQEICRYLAENPKAGDLIQGTGGARKVRFRSPGSGKSGGYRVITYYAAADVPVFLLDVYAKGEKVTLTDAERNELKKWLSTIATDYRQSTREKVRVMKGGVA